MFVWKAEKGKKGWLKDREEKKKPQAYFGWNKKGII